MVYDDALAFTHDLAIECFERGGDKIDVKRLSRCMALAVMRSKHALRLKPSMDTLERLGKVGYIECESGTVYFDCVKSFVDFKSLLSPGELRVAYCKIT